ncbi:Flp pilus assembly protein CpaB [Aquicoccus sp. G2-2]|uniref:Flp pilus assembly protein CpaB n=1 Tax=Aquicoccus sp. G2-2 TaxID=3092120 RepID=UPI002AE04803|nr:Flp pilus assembly protein CpaB [Aquicoccus sp. G2-2]MEA1112526.1 Flp pilus assembly protein CpaB [Aquicoccus sp. G2-2]
MRAVFGLVLIVGLALAGFAVHLISQKFNSYESEIARLSKANGGMINTVEVFVARHPMKYGDMLKPEDVARVKWPANLQPKGVFNKVEDLFPPNAGDRVMLRTIEQNEVLSSVKVTKPGETAGITSLLSRGMRAFTVKVDASSGVSGFLRPGHRVDVYWTGELNMNGERREITKLIEAGVQIIAIDQSANVDAPTAKIARTVTVAIPPEQAAGLAQAQSTGRLSLSLVGTGDNTIAADIEVDQDKLLGIERAAAPVRQKEVEKKVCTIRTRRGAEVVEIPIPCTD